MAEFPVDSVKTAGENILRIMHALEASQENIYENEEYQSALTQYENSLNAQISNQFRPAINDSKGRKLKKLFEKYSSEAQRVNNPEAYVEDLTTILAETKRGREAINCFNDVSDSRVSNTSIIFTDIGDGNDRTLATYNANPDPSTPGKYIKTIEFNPRNMTPEDALITLAHEMKHACMSSEMIDLYHTGDPLFDRMDELRTRYEALRDQIQAPDLTQLQAQPLIQQLNQINDEAGPISAQINDVQKKMNRLFALDEVKAYRLGSDLFNEFAVYHPPSFCDGVGASSFFGGVLTKGEYASSIESDLDSGQFIHSLIENYSRGNGYDPSFFYQTQLVTIQDENGQVYDAPEVIYDGEGKPILEPDFERQYKKVFDAN